MIKWDRVDGRRGLRRLSDIDGLIDVCGDFSDINLYILEVNYGS